MEKGCGCALLFAIGLLSIARMLGSVMGDYIGPPEGAAQDIHDKNVTILTSFCMLIACTIIGILLLRKRE